MHEAKSAQIPHVTVWGTGKPRREFLHVDDLAAAAIHLLEWYTGEQHVNVGTGRDLTIEALAESIRNATGFGGRLVFDSTKPDGVSRKLLDISKLTALGWRPKIELSSGLAGVYQWYLSHGDVQGDRAG